MTDRRNRKGQEINLLKAILLTSALGAALLGTRLLGSQDNQTQDIDQTNAPLIFQDSPASQLSVQPGEAIILNLQPVPQAFTPHIQPIQRVQPVARTRTS